MASKLRFSQLELIIVILSFLSAFVLCLLVAWPVNSNLNPAGWVVGFIEEPVKIVGVYVLALLFPVAFLSKKKCAIYGAAAGLGFAVMENIYYIMIYLPSLYSRYIAQGVSPAAATEYINHMYLVRAVICAPGHVIWTAIAALGIVYVVVDRSQWWKTLLFLLIAIALHGFYDEVVVTLGSNVTESYMILAAYMALSFVIFFVIYKWMPETGVPEEQVAVLIAPPNDEILVQDNKIFGRDDFAPYIPFTEAGQISREQFRISRTGRQFLIEDLASRGGTRVNGVRLKPNTRVVLSQGSKITLPNEMVLLFTTKGFIAGASPKTTLRVPESAGATTRVEPTSTLASSKDSPSVTMPLRAKLVGPGNAEVYVTESKEFGRDDFRKIMSEDKLPFISRRHFAIQVSGDAYSIEDLHSNNGTMLNGERLQPGERRTLKQGDKISCGNVLQLEFQPPV
jgi:pSer/pThr/pTyr-binding forkhead associated (FHA) protein/RsiW-degrading membrane proteinase PrsW (M82 family)